MKKQTVGLAVMLILCASFAVARPAPSSTRFSNSLLSDVVEMTKAGMPETTIVAFVKARRALLDSVVSADDLIGLRRSGVDDSVIRYIASVTAVDVGPTGEGRRGEASYDSGGGADYPVEPAYGAVYPYPYAYGYPVYGGPYFSGSVFVGRPFFRSRFFFHRPFFRNRFFFHNRFFFRRPFFHHRVFFRNRGVHRPFFRGRRF